MMSRKKLTVEEEHAARLITASQIFDNLWNKNAIGIKGVPVKYQAGSPDPNDLDRRKLLTENYRYYRIADPNSTEGRRSIQLLTAYGYVPAEDGEYYPSMEEGPIFRCHPDQYKEAQKARRMLTDRELQKIERSQRSELQEAARYKFGSADVTAEIRTETLK